MGIDLEKKKRGRRKLTKRKRPRSGNIYLKLLFKLYDYLARRTNSAFNKTISQRLVQSINHRPPVTIQMLTIVHKKRLECAPSSKSPILVVVGTVTDDHRILDIPKGLKVCCLKIVESARLRITNAGGEVLTFDELALREPLGKNTCLVRGPMKAGRKWKHFAGRPYVKDRKKSERGKHHGHVKRKFNEWKKKN